jgi:hypothetical protein
LRLRSTDREKRRLGCNIEKRGWGVIHIEEEGGWVVWAAASLGRKEVVTALDVASSGQTSTVAWNLAYGTVVVGRQTQLGSGI